MDRYVHVFGDSMYIAIEIFEKTLVFLIEKAK